MVRVTIFFIGGILLGCQYPNLIKDSIGIAGLAFLLLLYVTLRHAAFKKARVMIGAVGLLFIFLAGYLHAVRSVEWGKEGHLSVVEDPLVAYIATVNTPPEEKERFWRYEIKVHRLKALQWTNVTALSLLYVEKDSLHQPFSYGDQILIYGNPSPISEPRNPQEFNFKRFLSFKRIHHQHFVSSSQVVELSPIKTKGIRYYSYQVRDWASNQLKQHVPNMRENAIALALTLGVTDGIDNDLQKAYAASGAMHVLAVSGLHVGILYGIVLFLFKPLQRWSWSRWVVTLVSLLMLWAFAFVTGLSPSVLRAVTMFSFIALAKPFGRRTSIYNTLTASAFILLMYDPFLIMSVGFQLSYLAVFGIVILHRPLYQTWEIENAVLDWVWKLSCVAIAAQLTTFSLGLLYFHQFPVFFLLSNLFVIPGAMLVLVSSLMVLTTSFIPFVSQLIGQGLEMLIKLLNYGVFSIEKLPYSLIENIYISTMQCWMIMIALAFLILLFNTRKMLYAYISTIAISLFSFFQWTHYFDEVNHNRLVIYQVSGHTAVEFISKGNSILISDAQLATDHSKIGFHIQPNRVFLGVNRIKNYMVSDSTNLIQVLTLPNARLGIILEPISAWPNDIKLDFLVIGNDAFRSLEEIKKLIDFDQLILDSSNTPYIASRIKNSDPGLVYSVIHDGAYQIKF